MGAISNVIRYLLYSFVITGAIVFLPSDILLDINPTEFDTNLPSSLDSYTKIENVKVSQFKIVANISGPESIASFNGKVVTGSADGYIYQVEDSGQTKPLVKILDIPGCESQTNFHTSLCGHPLGIKFDSKGVLFVVEPAYGIYKVENIFSAKPKVSQVFDIRKTGVLGKVSKFLDDVAIEEKATGHVLYISDVSTRFSLEQFALIVYGSDMGRIIRFDTSTKSVEIIADNLLFPNGVEVSHNNEALLFVETLSRNVWKYHLKGAKKDKLQQIISRLPGELDNIRLSPKGKTFWIAVFNPRISTEPIDLDYYIGKPLLRKLMLRVTNIAGIVLAKIGQITQNKEINKMAHSLVNMEVFASTLFADRGGILLEIDINGNVVSSVHSDPRNSKIDLGNLSEVKEVPSVKPNERTFYLGSYGMQVLRKIVIAA